MSFQNVEIATRRFSRKSIFKNCVKFTGNYIYRSPFFTKVAEWNLATALKEYPKTCSSVNFAHFLKKTYIYFVEHLRTVASECE